MTARKETDSLWAYRAPADPGHALSGRRFTLMYRPSAGGVPVFYTHGGNDESLAAFLGQTKVQDLRLVPRAERRLMWLAERKRYKKIIRVREKAVGARV